MLFDSVAYKNVISNGLALDKKGNKMSKRLGNAVNPFSIINKYGADATRWYMISNAQPWDNLKFDENGIAECQRKFFGTLYNTYSFFALYANIDQFNYNEKPISISQRSELDIWIISELNTLTKKVELNYESYEPTKAARLIQDFAIDKLSNWYVRLSRRRFWKGEYNKEKVAAYQTLYECLETISILAAPIAPFFMDQLFMDLNKISKNHSVESVHLTKFPQVNNDLINADLERKMDLAQNITSLALSLRKKENLRVRQPLHKIMIPILDKKIKDDIKNVESIIKSEINVKNIELIDDNATFLVKKIKPNFKTLGPKFGGNMNLIVKEISQFSPENILEIEKTGVYKLSDQIKIKLSDVIISSDDIPGFSVINGGGITVALDIKLNTELKEEGLAREFINRIQNLRKEKRFDVTDTIIIEIKKNEALTAAINNNLSYICNETLAT